MTQGTLQLFPDKISATPMMQQYMQIKEHYADALLFYRMGDFYELFFEDALKAAEVLDIALTKRGKHAGEDIPMCGVPYHSSDAYLHKLIDHGFNVAICEQMESPEEAKKRGYKAVVKRDVVRIVTPATITEDTLLDGKEMHYLVSLAKVREHYALAWLDLSTGEFVCSATTLQSLASDMARLSPREILISHDLVSKDEVHQQLSEVRNRLVPQAQAFFDVRHATERVLSFFELGSSQSLQPYSSEEIAAIGATLEYVLLTQRGKKPRLALPKQCKPQQYMHIDPASRRNLELHHTLSGEKRGSFMHAINRTVSQSGSRLLHRYLSMPLLDAEVIRHRQDMVAFFMEQLQMMERLRSQLKEMPDLERALSRIGLERGGPRDLVMVRQALQVAIRLRQDMSLLHALPQLAMACLGFLEGIDDMAELLARALKDDVPMLMRDGGFIAEGFDASLDMLNDLKAHSRERLTALRDRYRAETGVSNLKLSFNNLIGYYIEVTNQHYQKLSKEIFHHKQTLASAVRFTTEELKILEQDILQADQKILAIEEQHFISLCEQVGTKSHQFIQLAEALAVFDVMTSFAHLAMEKHYVCPKVDESKILDIRGGRHVVVEQMLAKTSDAFMPNHCVLNSEERLWLITGPNMAGKSTFLRQNALIILLAQIGSFVPAESAHIGVVDRLFCRVGAADDLARGQSTFMVEMMETATILKDATPRSFVILDEIGRGTSTYDGVSIAWACLEYLHHAILARGLFATHYHELTQLVETLPALRNYTVKVEEWKDKVIFMHEVIPGQAKQSYGIYVAKLAGLPDSVVARAGEVLKNLQTMHHAPRDDHPVATAPMQPAINEAEQEKLRMIDHINLDELSPKQALDFIYRLKS